ncbi:hypothetical protein AKKGGB_AKKGGB_12975, partial [Dysosmobacter welbionis]
MQRLQIRLFAVQGQPRRIIHPAESQLGQTPYHVLPVHLPSRCLPHPLQPPAHHLRLQHGV